MLRRCRGKRHHASLFSHVFSIDWTRPHRRNVTLDEQQPRINFDLFLCPFSLFEEWISCFAWAMKKMPNHRTQASLVCGPVTRRASFFLSAPILTNCPRLDQVDKPAPTNSGQCTSMAHGRSLYGHVNWGHKSDCCV